MIYLALKSFHVLAIVTWVSGLLMLSLVLAGLRNSAAPYMPRERRFMVALKYWNHTVTSSAMLLTWVLGVSLTMMGGWLPAPWLILKLTFVLLLSALQGIETGMLQRLISADYRPLPSFVRFGASASLFFVAMIVLLVMTKPPLVS
ncbi:CopD family protein [Pseudomonas prosekii]|uniref:CopD family protein n=1 Tax=Pseudomonas prosekii TaxID=1148509 RepID=UPI0011EAB8CD|nr:CopD family protein [Pseudomonas prosekii]